ncbi:hypothetical protein AAG570_004620 [Ranatra chinensis]|uniref:Uncharacterized protein n=1 Tax=Ranatra chinensis TaxID=642074 RepID=A0ABD0Y1D6_9HEMI
MASKRRNMFYENKKQETTEIEVYCDYPQSPKLEMASKDRNMFYENKKQETTEICTVFVQRCIPPLSRCREATLGLPDLSPPLFASLKSSMGGKIQGNLFDEVFPSYAQCRQIWSITPLVPDGQKQNLLSRRPSYECNFISGHYAGWSSSEILVFRYQGETRKLRQTDSTVAPEIQVMRIIRDRAVLMLTVRSEDIPTARILWLTTWSGWYPPPPPEKASVHVPHDRKPSQSEGSPIHKISIRKKVEILTERLQFTLQPLVVLQRFIYVPPRLIWILVLSKQFISAFE